MKAELLIEHFKGLNFGGNEDPDVKEIQLIDSFIEENNQAYEFPKKEHSRIAEEILEKRLCNRDWLSNASQFNLFKVL